MDFIDELYADKELSALKRLTLIIPTYNRNYYLSRCLWYHAHFPFGEIIVADSSQPEKKQLNRDIVNEICRISDVNIRYLEYKPETEKYGGDIYQKWSDAVQHVNTEYSEFCTDKEFLVPTTLCASIDFLDTHPDFSIAEGMDYLIQSFSHGEIEFDPWQGEISFDQDTPEQRIIACLAYKPVVGTLFSVLRAKNQKKIYANLEKYHIWDIRFGEIALEMQPFLFGKIKKFHALSANCRDVLHYQESKSIQTTTNKSESSFTRYPLLNEYPENHLRELGENLGNCFQGMQRELYDCGSISEVAPLENYVVQLMQKRYVAQHPLFRKCPLLFSLWKRLPIRLQWFLSRHLGDNPLKPVSAVKTKEMECIEHVITHTQRYYENDEVIPLQGSAWTFL